MVDTSRLGSTIMETMLKEVSDFCNSVKRNNWSNSTRQQVLTRLECVCVCVCARVCVYTCTLVLFQLTISLAKIYFSKFLEILVNHNYNQLKYFIILCQITKTRTRKNADLLTNTIIKCFYSAQI